MIPKILKLLLQNKFKVRKCFKYKFRYKFKFKFEYKFFH